MAAERGSAILKVIVIIFELAVIGTGVYFGYMYYAGQQQKQVACTMEAKLCPDGSSVGRTGPNCEFAQCPAQNGITLKQIENASYDVSSEGLYFSSGMFGPKDKNYNPNALKLVNGSYVYGPDHITYPSGCASDVTHSASIAKNSAGVPLVAFGDLNGDGQGDAAVVLNLTYEENNKAGPHDYCLTQSGIPHIAPILIVLINKNGQPFQVDQYMGRNGPVGIFVATDMESIKIKNGIINLMQKNKEDGYKLLYDELVKIGEQLVAGSIPAGWKTYANDNLGISFKYPLDISPKVSQLPDAYKNSLPDGIYILVTNNDFRTCSSSLPGYSYSGIPIETLVGQVPFYKIAQGDAAMGTYNTEIQYAAFRDNKCYQIGVQYFTHNCSNYLPLEAGNTALAKAYNDCLSNNAAAEKLQTILDQIVSTFIFTK